MLPNYSGRAGDCVGKKQFRIPSCGDTLKNCPCGRIMRHPLLIFRRLQRYRLTATPNNGQKQTQRNGECYDTASRNTNKENLVALPPGMKVTFVDRPNLTETFTDSLETFIFNNNILRVDFCCGRLETPKPPASPSVKKYPVCRLVMPLDTAVDLFNQLNQLFGVLEQSGAIKRETSGSVIPPTVTKH